MIWHVKTRGRDLLDSYVVLTHVDDIPTLLQRWNVKPDPAVDVEKERALRKLGTLGVVKLFNAINQQQRKFAPVAATPEPEKPGFQKLSQASFLGLLAKSGGGGSGAFVGAGGGGSGVHTFSRGKVGEPVAKAPWLQETFEAGNDVGDDDMGDIRAKAEESSGE